MRLIPILASFALASLVAAGADEKGKPTIKEISTKDLAVTVREDGRPSKPDTITSAEALARSPVVGKAAAEIKKQIDFDKQRLLVFSWSGSGQDRITAAIGTGSDKEPVIAVTYKPGRTYDLRQHVQLFVVPKDLKVIFESGR